jgi:hypothetical protein
MPERPPRTVVAPPEPIIRPGYTLATVTDKISSIVLTPGVTKGWLGGFAIAGALFLLLSVVMTYQSLPRVHSFEMEYVFPHTVGLGDSGRIIRFVFRALLSIY